MPFCIKGDYYETTLCPHFLLALCAPLTAAGREAKLVRYPHYHQGRIAFTYLGDIWTADEDGKNIQRLTANKARDVYPRFSPDGKWIAFSSDRNGNLDVFIIPSEGGAAKQLTFHSADDTVLGWSPDSRAVLFASQPRRRLHRQALHRRRSTAAWSAMPAPIWACMPATRPTAGSWRSIARGRSTGASTIAAPTRPT